MLRTNEKDPGGRWILKFYGSFEWASDAQQYVKKSDPSTKGVRSYGHEKTRNGPAFASHCSRPPSGWANGTLKLLLAPDWPDRTASEKLEKILGCSKLALPEATKLVLASKLGQQNLA